MVLMDRPKYLEHQRRHQQRHRNGGQRDEGGAGIEQEQEQDDRHHDGAVPQGFLHVGHRVLDEVRLLEQEARCLDTRRQGFGQVGQGLFHLAGQGHAVG
jgi:hypothetical protein